jgi:hypothetical protein
MGYYRDPNIIDRVKQEIVHDRETLEPKLNELGYEWDEFLTLKCEDITQEVLAHLKQNDIPKPPNVTHATWLTPINFTRRHQKIVQGAALGHTVERIAEDTGYSVVAVKTYLRSEIFKKKIAKKQESYIEGQMRTSMKILFNKAFSTVDEILDNKEEKTSVRLDASKFVIDHTLGKAPQSIDMQSSTLAEFMRKLDEMQASAPAIPVQNLLPHDPDPNGVLHGDGVVEKEIDIVDSFKEVNVGKRTK